MAKKIKYLKLVQYNKYFEEIKKEKRSFKLQKTTYSRIITINNKKIIFNDKGETDYKTLALISKVRKDAKRFLKYKEWNSVSYIDFFNMLNIPNSNEVISKVDIKAAYWSYAKMNNVISEQTDQYLKEKFVEHSYEFTKQARLKALGSLATTKRTIHYVNGILDYEEEPITQPTKPIYMNICKGIDDIMKECSVNIDGCIYYYWDCMFIKKKFEEQALNFFKSKRYDVGINETRLEYINISGNGFLCSQSDGKIYMTKKENKHLIWN